jgi:hypothetical protein
MMAPASGKPYQGHPAALADFHYLPAQALVNADRHAWRQGIGRVVEQILDVKRPGLPIVLVSHNMPHVFEVADRSHIRRQPVSGYAGDWRARGADGRLIADAAWSLVARTSLRATTDCALCQLDLSCRVRDQAGQAVYVPA